MVEAVATSQGVMLNTIAILLAKTPGFDKDRFFKKFDVTLEGAYSE